MGISLTSAVCIAAAGAILQLSAQRVPDMLLTIPQRDTGRSRTAPATAHVSADGRFVAFVSHARLVPADTNNRADVYVLNKLTNEVTLESAAVEGSPLQGDSGHPRLSGDGRYLVFDTATTTTAGSEPTVRVVMKDRSTGTARWVSHTPDGASPNGRSNEPAISADGTVLVFASTATDLVAGSDGNGLLLDVYLYETATRRTRRVSLDDRHAQGPATNSLGASVSATGRYVAFTAFAPLDGAAGTPNRRTKPLALPRPRGQVFVRDVHLGITTRVSVSSRGEPANDGSWGAAISDDGNYVAFASVASNLVPDDGNGAADVFVHDRRSGETTLLSRSARRGTANGTSLNPAISADGRFVAFQSDASDLLCAARCSAADDDTNLLFDVFMADRTAGRMRRISGAEKGWIEESGGPAIDASGTIVAFTSRRPLDGTDVANDFDLFVSVPARQSRPAAQMPRPSSLAVIAAGRFPLRQSPHTAGRRVP